MSKRSSPSRPWYVRWGITFVVGLLIVFLMALGRDVFQVEGAARVWRILCDGCFLAAVLLICAGLMTFVSSEGMFDILSYGFICFGSLFRSNSSKKVRANPLPGGETSEDNGRPDFYEYKKSKAEGRSAHWYLFFVGLIYLAAAFLCLLMFNLSGGIPMA